MNTPLLTLNQITAGYENKIVLKNVNLTINEGDFILICGPNGGGKTTLLRTLAQLLSPQTGTIRRKPNCIVGYLPQYRGIDRTFPINVRETLLSGLNCRKATWQRFTDQHQQEVDKFLNLFDLTALQDKPISALSGGQWQRTLLARSLVGNPDLWLLDEPDTHLDAKGQTYLHELLKTEREKRAIIVVTHFPQTLAQIAHCRTWHVNEQMVQEDVSKNYNK